MSATTSGGGPGFLPRDGESHAQRKLPYLYPATVTANVDPKGLRRVRFKIPGLIEPEGPWALPLATAGGGSKNRGGVIVPELGATVGAMFAFGDPAHPYYLSGPQAVGEPVEADPNVWTLVYDNYEIRWDKATKRLRVRNTTTGDTVDFDGLLAGVRVYAVGELSLEAAGRVSINAAIVEINGRPVLPGTGPIR